MLQNAVSDVGAHVLSDISQYKKVVCDRQTDYYKWLFYLTAVGVPGVWNKVFTI